MQFNFFHKRQPATPTGSIAVGEKQVLLAFVTNHRARRYILRVRSDGTARVTIPRGGSASTARQFAEKNVDWLRRQMQRVAARPVGKAAWHVGSEIFFRGEMVKIAAGPEGASKTITFADQTVRIRAIDPDCRPMIEHHLHRLAAVELPPKVFHLARLNTVNVQRVVVRNQKSRWGSCSRRGTISLNWRLIQAPGFVADYVTLHELMHLRQMNHSRKFWQEMETVCPDFREAERWLKAHSDLLR